MYVRNVLLAIGITALVIGATLAVLWLRQGGAARKDATSAPPHQSVLVATHTLRAGTLLRAEDVAWKTLPRTAIPATAIVMTAGTEQSYMGAIVRRDFAAGEPLVSGGLVLAGTRDFLAAVLLPGMRAVSIPVTAASSAAGLIQPGDHVDVILAQSLNSSSQSQNAVSETVLQNVRVIAVDQTFAAGARSDSSGGRFGKPESRIPKTVTLEVSEADAKRLLVATQLGKVTLAVRALQGAYAASPNPAGDSAPVWASDVSAAIGGKARASMSAGHASVTILRGAKAEIQ